LKKMDRIIERSNAPARLVLSWFLAAAVWAGSAEAQNKEQFELHRSGAEDANKILLQHEKWVDSNGKEGRQADFETVETGSVNSKTTLDRARFHGANLKGSQWINVSFVYASFTQANLTGARFIGCDFSFADLKGADVSNAAFLHCTLNGVFYDQKFQGYPDLGALAGNDLSKLTCDSDRGSELGLVQLRNAFKANNLRAAEREVTYAIEKRRTVQLWKDGHWGEAIFRTVLFDWPAGYGLYFDRPLKLLCLLIALFTPVYFIAIAFRSHFIDGGIWEVPLKDAVGKNGEADPVPVHFKRTDPRWWNWLPAATGALRTAVFFSLMSAVRMGYRDLNVGSWLANMQPREYALRGTGWVRTVSGVQSLLGVYLIALWLISYFGRPFE
jgi:uncharacterized protein YjbI with pentapeptide repeats